jgi:hypothetical protein
MAASMKRFGKLPKMPQEELKASKNTLKKPSTVIQKKETIPKRVA